MIEREQLMPFLLQRRASDDPDGVFLRQVETDAALTWRQAHDGALRWARGLAGLGVGRHDTVITMLPTGFDVTVAWVGLQWLVAWEVPVNTGYHGRMLDYTIANSEARVAVISERYLDRLAALDHPVGRLDTVVVPDATGPLPDLPYRVLARDEFFAGAAVDSGLELVGPEPWDVCDILYTSGTTGASKGVLFSHAQLHASTTATMADWGPDEVFYDPFPMYHVSGKYYVYAAALTGRPCVIKEQFRTDDFWPDIKRHGCTVTLLLGAMANFVFRQPVHPDEVDTPLRVVIMVPLIPELAEFNERFGVRTNTVFNMTEICSPIVALADEVDTMPWTACGRRREGFEVRVVDEHDIEVPDGELGELIVRADEPWVLNSGYFNMPDKTAEAWRNGWFHTGDGFVRDADGWFTFVDRKKDAIRRRGENISSMEVESFVNEHPAVLESAAVAVPSEWGEDEVKVVVVPQPGESVAPAELHTFLTERMPRFMVPRYVEVVAELPKTPTEKIRKVQLRESGVSAATWDATA